jgi:hypothetical protein
MVYAGIALFFGLNPSSSSSLSANAFFFTAVVANF